MANLERDNNVAPSAVLTEPTGLTAAPRAFAPERHMRQAHRAVRRATQKARTR